MEGGRGQQPRPRQRAIRCTRSRRRHGTLDDVEREPVRYRCCTVVELHGKLVACRNCNCISCCRVLDFWALWLSGSDRVPALTLSSLLPKRRPVEKEAFCWSNRNRAISHPLGAVIGEVGAVISHLSHWARWCRISFAARGRRGAHLESVEPARATLSPLSLHQLARVASGYSFGEPPATCMAWQMASPK